MKLFIVSFGAAIAALGLVAACSSDSDSNGTTNTQAADCEAIVEACHPKDPGSGDIHECHEGAESAPDKCTAAKESCIALCNAAPVPTDTADSGTSTDEEGKDASSE